uniref:TLC domain-containing protein n=1 Tax=viral metagenome TaxID=1070528 RepID=A0A6C0F784_9ZZZZ
MMNIFLPLPSVFFYYYLNKELNKYQEKKIANNSTSLFHASTSIIIAYASIYLNFDNYLLYINTSGYLLYDIYYIIKINKFDILQIMYIYHHIVLLSYIILPYDIHYWREILLFSELSNIPNKLVYYSLKNDKKKGIKRSNVTNILLKFQLLVYFILRIFFIGYYGIKELNNDKVDYIKLPIYMVSVLYLFGVVWFVAMFKQNIKK